RLRESLSPPPHSCASTARASSCSIPRVPSVHCAGTVRNCPAVARDFPGCADAFYGSEPSARPPPSNRSLFPSGGRAARDAAHAAPRPGAALLPPSPGSSTPTRLRACPLLLAADRRPRSGEKSSEGWDSLRGPTAGILAPLVAGRSDIE